MSRQYTLSLAILVAMASSASHAIDGSSLTLGFWSKTKLEMVRLDSSWRWQHSWKHAAIELSGHWQPSLNYLHIADHHNNEHASLWIVGLSPVWRLSWNTHSVSPYLEAGIGLAGMSDNQLGQKDLGSYWNFEDRVGFGILLKDNKAIDLSIRYFHYSNAGTVMPNAGIDLYTFGLGLWF